MVAYAEKCRCEVCGKVKNGVMRRLDGIKRCHKCQWKLTEKELDEGGEIE